MMLTQKKKKKKGEHKLKSDFINTIITQLGHNAFPGTTSRLVDSLSKCLPEIGEWELHLHDNDACDNNYELEYLKPTLRP